MSRTVHIKINNGKNEVVSVMKTLSYLIKHDTMKTYWGIEV